MSSRLVALLLLALLTHPALADDADARGAALLAGLGPPRAELCRTQRLGLLRDGAMIGTVVVALELGIDAEQVHYAFRGESAVREKAGGPKLFTSWSGRLDGSLAPLGGAGNASQGQSPTLEWMLERRDAVLSWTQQAPTERSEPIAGAQTIAGIELLVARAWITLPESLPVRVQALDLETGRLRPVELRRGPIHSDVVAGLSRELVPLEVRETLPAGPRLTTYQIDRDTAQIHEIAVDGAPVVLRAITADTYDAWEAGKT